MMRVGKHRKQKTAIERKSPELLVTQKRPLQREGASDCRSLAKEMEEFARMFLAVSAIYASGAIYYANVNLCQCHLR